MNVNYFARWSVPDGPGLQPLSFKRVAAIDTEGQTYVAHLPDERLVLTVRREAQVVGLGFLGDRSERLGGVALILGPPTQVTSMDITERDQELVRLEAGDGGVLRAITAPFSSPSEFQARPVPDLAFPSVGDYEALAALPRDPWDYVELPRGFDPPRRRISAP